jgi:hypothetical protein
VHRHESHKGPAIGSLLPQEVGVINVDKVGAKPSLEVAKVIAANEAPGQRQWSPMMLQLWKG